MARSDERGRLGERLISGPWRWLLAPAWLAYRPLIAVRNRAYDLGWLPRFRLPAPVVSIGNLTVGGTGKTPLVELVTERLRALGQQPTVLSRGYGGDGGPNEEASLVGAPIICDPDRVRGGNAALAAGATCLVLDDGFQHRRLARDLDLVLIDATRPWGTPAAQILPLGLMREPRSSLKRAHAIVLTRCDQCEPAILAELARGLGRFGKPVLRAEHAPQALIPLAGGDEMPADALRGTPVVLASGIGNPAAFERTGAALGWLVRRALRFADHHHYDQEDLSAIIAAATEHRATVVITTKDAVKLAALIAPSAAVRVLVLRTRIRMSNEDDRQLDQLLSAAIATAGA